MLGFFEVSLLLSIGKWMLRDAQRAVKKKWRIFLGVGIKWKGGEWRWRSRTRTRLKNWGILINS